MIFNYSEDDYKEWLIKQITSNKYPYENYSELLDYLYYTDYIWSVRNDENRESDGRDLRRRYENETGSKLAPSFIQLTASVLEVLAALAIRCEHDITAEPGDEHPEKWFWIYIHNLGLDDMTNYDFDIKKVRFVISNWLHRRYSSDGKGGIFPVDRPFVDQQKSELWIQMNQYLLEKYPID